MAPISRAAVPLKRSVFAVLDFLHNSLTAVERLNFALLRQTREKRVVLCPILPSRLFIRDLHLPPFDAEETISSPVIDAHVSSR